MKEIKRFQIRELPGDINRADFDGDSSTHRGQTWQVAQSALRVSQALGISPPAIIAVWHSRTKDDPWGRDSSS